MLAALACALALAALRGRVRPAPRDDARRVAEDDRGRGRRGARSTASTRTAPGRCSSTRSSSARARPARRSRASSPPTSRRGCRAGATRTCPAGCATSSARSPARASRSCSPRTTTRRTSRTSWAPTTARAAPRRCSSSRAACRRPSARRTRRRSASSPSTARRPPTTTTSTAPACAARRRTRKKHAQEMRELVLLDFVADKDLAIPREESSDEEMWADLRAAAAHVGAGAAFPDETQGTVHDDHTPFVRARRPVDRPDRLHVRLLAPDLRRHHRGLEGVAGHERRGRARVPVRTREGG